MNIVKKCKELVYAEFDNAVEGNFDSSWMEAFQKIQTADVKNRVSFARVSGKDVIHLPAVRVIEPSLAVRVMAKGLRVVNEKSPLLVLEPLNTPLPEGLILLPTLVISESHTIPVQVMNISSEDVWLKPKMRLGVLTYVDSVSAEEECEVKF